MLILCIILIIAAAGFGSREVVNVFGFNIYIVQAEGFEKAPKGSAVIVKKAAAFDIPSGKLILYEKGGDGNQYALGYVKEPHVVDGVFFLTVTDNVSTIEVPEGRLVGTANYSSVLVGSIIGFIKTPFGIFCVAVMPCLALILYDIIRAAALSMPDPEVEPQIKNRREEVVTQRNISVKGDGNAAYSKTNTGKSAADANDVLFNYSQKKQSEPKERSRQNDRLIIPLTDKTAREANPQEAPRENVKKRVNPGAMPAEAPRTPEAVGVSRYISNSRDGESTQDKTAELPDIGKSRDSGDAFFAQTTATSAVIPKSMTAKASGGSPANPSAGSRGSGGQAPQIGRQIPKRTNDELEERGDPTVSHRTSGKRSAQILASKRVEDLISDDDEARGKNRFNDSVVDDIISGINRHDDT